MPNLPKKKVGLISCSGEELPAGTLSRMATLRALEALRPDDTVTLCLPLFLAGDDKERAFARFYPTIAIDGCDRRCAARATEKYSARPAASIVIPQVFAERGWTLPATGRRQSDFAGASATVLLAEEIAGQVDEILGLRREPRTAESETTAAPDGSAGGATCSCGSGIPVMNLMIAGKSVQVLALPLIFDAAREQDQSPEQMFDVFKLYNAIPAGLESLYREAICRAYADFVARGPNPEA